jgi:hypothetical protein
MAYILLHLPLHQIVDSADLCHCGREDFIA